MNILYITIRSTLCIIMTILLCAQPLCAHNSTILPEIPNDNKHTTGPDSRFFDMFDDQGFMDDPVFDEFLDTVDSGQLLREIKPQDIITFLGEANGIKILQEDLFLRTNPLNKRSLLDLPVFEIHQCCPPHNWIVGAHLFYNQTTRANFTADCTDLRAYLALKQPTLIEKLQSAIEQLKDLFPEPELNIDVARIFKLFERMTIQDRRTGFMFHALRQWSRAEFRLLLPFYYLEQNFFLTEQEQEAAERGLRSIGIEFGATSPEAQKQFEEDHFIGDKIGFGDTRCEFDVEVWNGDLVSIRLGVQATIPTAFAIKRGLKGNSFEDKCSLPTFDFDELFELAEKDTITEEDQQKAFDMLSEFFLGVLDRLSNNLIVIKLGNNGHFGIGGFIRTKTPLTTFIERDWAERFIYNNRISFEYFFIAKEKRSFILKNDSDEFARRDFCDEAQAENNLQFLEQEFVNRSHLVSVDVTIHPGLIFRWTSRLCYQGKRWECNIGSDFWLKTTERFDSISDIPEQFCSKLALQKAKPPLAYQSKLFGGVAFKFKRPKRDWYISLNGDGTTFRSGIGRDFTVSFNVEAHF